MKPIALMTVVVAGLIAVGIVNAQATKAQEGAALAQKHGCFSCHDADKKKVGPSFKDAAAKLKGKSNSEAVAAIKKAHPNLKATDEETEAMNEWMQSQFNRAAGM